MSKNSLRKDKTCLNCRHVVENTFCPNCGQKNEDTRKTFHHLFVHFFEDLTHYENAFWRTIRNLIFQPASLSIEYLSGKRLSYLAPIRLYLFISFITFFIITSFPNKNSDVIKISNKNSKEIESKETDLDDEDSVELKKKIFLGSEFGNIKELDSIQKFGKADEKLSPFLYKTAKKALEVVEDNTPAEIISKFSKSFVSNFPKALFLYMPFFAMILWLFHNKKRWYYFDHGIFTIHYFSYLLLLTLFLFLLNKFFSFFGKSTFLENTSEVVQFISILWAIWYFFKARRKMYLETRVNSFLKTVIIFIINFVSIFILLILFSIYTFINIH